MIVYKLTDQNMQTYNGFQWELGKWYETSGKGGLCGHGWLHFYTHPLLAVLLNPIHADIENPLLFEAETIGCGKKDRGLKVGYKKARLVKQLDLPKINSTQKTAFGVLCAMEVCKDKKWVQWAKNWLSGKDRSGDAALAAWAAAWTTKRDTARDAAWDAARDAAWDAAWAAAWAAARDAANAARAAARAAVGAKIDLIAIAQKAMEVK